MKKLPFTKIATLLPLFVSMIILTACGGGGKTAGTDMQKPDEKELATASLQKRCEMSKASFPLKVDEVTSQIDVRLTPNEIIHYFTIDEGGLGVTLDNERISPDALYGSILESLKLNRQDSVMRGEMEALVKTGRGIIYHYNGSKSGKEIEVKVSPEKLAEIMK